MGLPTPPMNSVPSPQDSEDALAAVVALRRTADQLELAAVAHAIEQGWTWSQVAQALGVSKQAVHKKYAKRIARADSVWEEEEGAEAQQDA